MVIPSSNQLRNAQVQVNKYLLLRVNITSSMLTVFNKETLQEIDEKYSFISYPETRDHNLCSSDHHRPLYASKRILQVKYRTFIRFWDLRHDIMSVCLIIL